MFGIQFASAYDVPQGRYSDYLPDTVQRFPYIGTVIISNSYNMGCPPVCGDSPRALARGLSYVQVDKHGIIILNHLHQCIPCKSRDISC